MEGLISGRFALCETLREGRAYHAHDTASGNDVFLKCWPSDNPAAVDEIAMISAIDSPFAPRFLCSFEENGLHYLAEEWIEGEPLDRLIRRNGRLSEEQALRLAEALCDALSFLHWHPGGPIVFLDLKPANIMVRGDCADGTFDVVLVDYEAARRLETETADEEKTKTRMLGSCYYTAPEAIFGTLAPTCDLYSVGAVLYTALTGKEGYPVASAVHGALHAITARCIDPEPEKRYADIGELRDALLQIGHRDGKTLPVPTTPRSACRYLLRRYRRSSVMIDCNTCFASEMAQTASESLGLRTGVFAVSEKGQRNLEYYFLQLNQLCELVCEDSYFPYIFDHQSLYLHSGTEWTERGLLHACSENLFISSSKLFLELPLRTPEDYDRFFEWCQANFDFVIFPVERQDDQSEVAEIMKRCHCIITTPLSNVEDLEAYRDYYISLADRKRVILSKVKFVAWDYVENHELNPERIAGIVGSERYLGEVSHSELHTRKKNRLPVQQPALQDGLFSRQYEQILCRLIG